MGILLDRSICIWDSMHVEEYTANKYGRTDYESWENIQGEIERKNLDNGDSSVPVSTFELGKYSGKKQRK